MVRPATPDDVPVVDELVRAAYEHYVPRIGREPKPMTVDYAQVVEQGQTWVAVEQEAGRQDRLVGVLVLEHADDHVLVENLAVLPQAQGAGIGGRLLAHAEEQARARGVRQVRLYTHELMTENRAYYPRRGYRETHLSTETPWRRAYFAKDLSS